METKLQWEFPKIVPAWNSILITFNCLKMILSAMKMSSDKQIHFSLEIILGKTLK